MVRSLDKKWKEFLFAFSGFGPNLLMVLMGAYFSDAINPAALPSGSYQAIMGGVCFILPALFPILYSIAKVFDGIIDIPLAHLTDSLSTKWGKRRPAILVCSIPMILSYAMCWFPIFGSEAQLLNTIWIIFWAFVFFATYTMCLIAFYGSLSSVCENEPQRLRVSSYKSFFDTISYCLVYALVPVILDGARLHVDKFVFLCLPLMLTIVIPLFMIKEGKKYGYPEKQGMQEEKVSLKESMRLTFKNKLFLRWLLVNSCTFIGLQMFLVSMNAMIIGGMGMNGLEMAILNTCAFAPVPVMLYLFNKLKTKKGIRFTYQTCLISFAVSIMSFFIGSKFIIPDNKALQMLIGCIGGVIGSWSIGAFFMMPYHVTAQVSSVEEKLTKKNHSAMYFAANAVVTSIVGAISGSLIYELIKMLFINKKTGSIVWAENFDAAASAFGADVSQVFNFGTLLVPIIVAIFCLLGAFLARKMPKDYTPLLVGKELKKQYSDLDISSVEQDEKLNKEEKGETIFVQVGLSVLSVFIFGFIWTAFLFKSIKAFANKKVVTPLWWALSCLIPFASVYLSIKAENVICEKANSLGGNKKSCKIALIMLGILFPLLPLNVIGLAILQGRVNGVYALEDKLELFAQSNVI
ncbi:MAG: hypothetical protein E7382_01265 [Clostridiales bacterium]|nr:hypothetical protein [Clostridiales bacterium]